MDILFATTNSSKISELRGMLPSIAANKVNVITINDINAEDNPPEESGLTFDENAAIKAKYYGSLTSLPCMSEDSGLCVEKLANLPGIYSADWCKGNPKTGIEKIYGLLSGSESPAYFYSSVCIYIPIQGKDAKIIISHGKLHGTIKFPQAGQNGFGYDPIFLPLGESRTLAQMEQHEKNSISHRKIAFDLAIRDFLSFVGK